MSGQTRVCFAVDEHKLDGCHIEKIHAEAAARIDKEPEFAK